MQFLFCSMGAVRIFLHEHTACRRRLVTKQGNHAEPECYHFMSQNQNSTSTEITPAPYIQVYIINVTKTHYRIHDCSFVSFRFKLLRLVHYTVKARMFIEIFKSCLYRRIRLEKITSECLELKYYVGIRSGKRDWVHQSQNQNIPLECSFFLQK